MISVRGYCRVSTDEQRVQETILTQQAELEKHCLREGLTLEKIYRDDGVSGLTPFQRRPQGGQLFEDARRGWNGILLVPRLDRVGRDTVDILTSISELKKLGVSVRSITQQTSDDASGQLQREILASFSSYERTVIRDRTRDASRRLAAAGVWLGGIVPFGYRKEGLQKEARLKIADDNIPGCDFSEAWVIRNIFRMAADGKTCVAIARYLKGLSVPTRYTQDGREVARGKRKLRTSGVWTPGRVRNLIVSPTYKGLYFYGKRKTSKGADDRTKYKALPQDQWISCRCPAIVDVELWERANACLHSNQLIAMAHARYQYLLRGKIKCGRCGLAFVGTKASGRKLRFYYRCNGKMGSRGDYGIRGEHCPSPSLSGEAIEGEIWTDLQWFIDKPGKVIHQLKEQMNSMQRNHGQIQDLEAAIRRAQAKRERWLEQYAEGLVDRKERDQRLAEVAAAQASAEKALVQARKLAEDVQAETTALASASALLRKLRDGSDRKSFETRRRIVEALVDSITVTEEDGRPKVTVKYRFDPHFERYMGGFKSPGRGTETLSYLPRDSSRQSA